MTALLRVSVVAGERRVDLAVPSVLPVAELVPGLARRLGVTSYDGLRLCTATGSVLADSAGLAPQRVPDGAVLCLAAPSPPPAVVDDPVEVLASTIEPPGGPPPGAGAVAAALLLGVGALAATAAGTVREAAAVALVLLAGALAVGRGAPGRGVVLACGACGYAAVAAGLLAADLRPAPGPVWSAAGGGAIAVAAVAVAGLPRRRLWMLVPLVVGAGAAVVGAVLAVRPVPVALAAAALVAVDVVVTAALPAVAVGLVSRRPVRADPVRVAEEARLARELVLGLTVGLGLLQVGLTPVVARHGPGGAALAACAAALALLRAHRAPGGAGALAGIATGVLCLLATAVVVLTAHPACRPAGSAVLAAAGGVLLLTPRSGPGGALARTARRALETAFLVATVPLLALVGGAPAGRW